MKACLFLALLALTGWMYEELTKNQLPYMQGVPWDEYPVVEEKHDRLGHCASAKPAKGTALSAALH